MITKICVACQGDFECPDDGYASRRKYCSHACSSRAYTKRYPDRRKESLIKYESNPDNKEKKRSRNRRTTLRRYGLNEDTFFTQLERQSFACYGCLTPLDFLTARNDHDHQSLKFRGILCDSCNWALGHVKDNPATLRRLMAYLDYQIQKDNIYVTGALKNPRVPEISNAIRMLGFDVMDEWFTPGEFADTNWQEYEKNRGRSYTEALRGRAATNIFLFDRSYLDHCDIVIMIMPAGKSAAIELGYAKGRGKHTIIFLDGNDPERYDIMPNLADEVISIETELLERLKGLKKENL